MGKDGWTTISIPDNLYNEVKALLPKAGVSVSEFARFWIGVGVHLDQARQANHEFNRIVDTIVVALRGNTK